MKGRYTTAVAVKLTGVSAYYLRRLDRAGLLNPCRTSGGQRLYTDRDIETIREIKRLREEGINLAGISVILKNNK